MTHTEAPASPPERMTPARALAREIVGALSVLGPSTFDDIAAVLRSRPVLVRDALELLADAGLIAAADGCYDLTAAGGHAA